MFKQDIAQKLLQNRVAECHPEWHRHCRNLASELLNRDPQDFMDFQAVKETMFVGNAEYTFEEFLHLKTQIDLEELKDCDVFSQNYQHPMWPTTGNTIHHRYHLHLLEHTTGCVIPDLESILELGGGYGNTARLIHKLGFKGQYYIKDLPEFEVLQQYYLDYHRVKVDWDNINLEDYHDLFIATWSLSEIPVDLRKPYETLSAKYFLIAFGPRYGNIDNLQYFKEYQHMYSNVVWDMFEAPYLPNQYYLIGGPQ